MSEVKIINGTPVPSVDTYPWFCQVLSREGGVCGGSYIGDNCVLTAAHCFYKNGQFINKPEDYRIVMGSLKLRSPGTEYLVLSIHPNPNFNSLKLDNDSCILKLSKTPSLDGFVPVSLVTEELKEELEEIGKETIVMGFGKTSDGPTGTLSPVLLEANVSIRSVGNADGTSYPPEDITVNMLTAVNSDPYKNVRQGDSGGPLLSAKDSKLYQIGIVSGGENNMDPNYPGVYARVSQFLNWISETCSSSPIGPTGPTGPTGPSPSLYPIMVTIKNKGKEKVLNPGEMICIKKKKEKVRVFWEVTSSAESYIVQSTPPSGSEFSLGYNSVINVVTDSNGGINIFLFTVYVK